MSLAPKRARPCISGISSEAFGGQEPAAEAAGGPRSEVVCGFAVDWGIDQPGFGGLT